uniref:Macaca fascicularis brain cDNA clone: QtrA-17031, similar to human KIAA1754 (KIAA1754), mRNA, RefSeq: NM_033397.1 n=1 Tax=Macaca fascicularis TaxID=9541 RepID=I7GKQ5_MACFA|nr:unnamed protein product [Macaca fascicularis]
MKGVFRSFQGECACMCVCVCVCVCVCMSAGGPQRFPSSPLPALPSPTGAQALCQVPPKLQGTQLRRTVWDFFRCVGPRISGSQDVGQLQPWPWGCSACVWWW